MVIKEIKIVYNFHVLKFVFFDTYNIEDYNEKEDSKLDVLHMILFVDNYYFKEGQFPIDDNADEEEYHKKNAYKHLISETMKSLMRKYKKDDSFSFLNEFDKFIKDGLKDNKIVDDLLLKINVVYQL